MIVSDYVEWLDEQDSIIRDLLPNDWVVKCDMEEEAEVFFICAPLNEEELIVALHDLGFKSDADCDDNWMGRSALTSPTILARQQKKILCNAVQSNTAPVASPSKI